jgi:XTP/dITP diphosphohydrolase
MHTLLLASRNTGKQIELKALLEGVAVEIAAPQSLGIDIEVVEDGKTYAENASKKAIAFARAAGLPALADDTGLEVEALNGEPGLYSARYAGHPDATDADRRRLLLEKLEGHPRPWIASFRCVVALALDGGEVKLAEGSCTGEIIPEERGTGGFGYDQIFYFPALGKTMAELDMEEKNQVSHRAMAVKAAIPAIKEWIENPDV